LGSRNLQHFAELDSVEASESFRDEERLRRGQPGGTWSGHPLGRRQFRRAFHCGDIDAINMTGRAFDIDANGADGLHFSDARNRGRRRRGSSETKVCDVRLWASSQIDRIEGDTTIAEDK